MRSRRLLLDGRFLCYAAAHSMGSLSHVMPDGEELRTGIVFGVMSRILSLAEMWGTSDIVYCWESGKDSVRRQEFPEYKANRKTDDPEQQRIRQEVESAEMRLVGHVFYEINIMCATLRGYESDDVIALLANDQTRNHVIVSADHDLFQLLRASCPEVSMWTGHKKITAQSFYEEWGIAPDRWSVVKIIAGCDSDGVPGVKGVGEKTAVKFLLGQLRQGTKTEQKVQAFIQSKAAVRNRRLVALPHVSIATCTLNPAFLEKTVQKRMEVLHRLSKEYGFNSFLQPDMQERWRAFFKGTPIQKERKK